MVGPGQRGHQTGGQPHQGQGEDLVPGQPPVPGHQDGQHGDHDGEDREEHPSGDAHPEEPGGQPLQGLVADVLRAGGPGGDPEGPEPQTLGGQHDDTDQRRHPEGGRTGPGHPGPPGEQREDTEQGREQLDRRGDADADAAGPAPAVVRQQVEHHQCHQQGVDLPVAEGGPQRLDRHQGTGPDQPEGPAPRHPAAAQHRLLGPDQQGDPQQAPEPLRPERQRQHHDGGERRVDVREVPARAQHVVDTLAVHQ
ncbi:hypothetical protein SDC9_100642 [bioreactor metagenome]|uniref:Uncharacterized protein n=1 Tax=bioreactor metagenome TaxID=1076179 RepID=A0A645AKW4_9ZZZZ